MGCTFLKFGNADGAIIQYKYQNRATTKLCLIVLTGMENILHKKVSIFKVYFNEINEQDTSFLDCKHMHKMKSGAPSDKVRVLHRLLPIKFHGFTSRIDLQGSCEGLSFFVSLSYLNFFRDGMGPFNKQFQTEWTSTFEPTYSRWCNTDFFSRLVSWSRHKQDQRVHQTQC